MQVIPSPLPDVCGPSNSLHTYETHAGLVRLTALVLHQVARSVSKVPLREYVLEVHPTCYYRAKSYSLNASLKASASAVSSASVCEQSCHCILFSRTSSLASTLRPYCRSNL